MVNFCIITHAVHKVNNGKFYSYEPYVREMNIWAKHIDKIVVVSPVNVIDGISELEAPYIHENIELIRIPNFDITSIINTVKSLFIIPVVLFRILQVMRLSNHIHLRCPGNIGLLGCLVQMIFPKKKKTVKYAGNWDPNSTQPLLYRFQKWMLSNTFLSKNIRVLVYGEWQNQTKNILPFFTASYSDKEIEVLNKKDFSKTINLIFVGSFSKGKQPLLSVMATHELFKKGHTVILHMYGEGPESIKVIKYISENDLHGVIKLHGNKSKSIVKHAFKKSHFLVFISKSEGWPKVVAEAMFWSCLPISSKVSCVPKMLDFGLRGGLVSNSKESIVEKIEFYINNDMQYFQAIENGMNWSQEYTIERFDTAIKKLL